MGNGGKYGRKVKGTKRKKQPEGSIEMFDAMARARGMTYAQAQIEETCRLYQKGFSVPGNYRWAGGRGL